jgi:hypothetical protein
VAQSGMFGRPFVPSRLLRSRFTSRTQPNYLKGLKSHHIALFPPVYEWHKPDSCATTGWRSAYTSTPTREQRARRTVLRMYADHSGISLISSLHRWCSDTRCQRRSPLSTSAHFFYIYSYTIYGDLPISLMHLLGSAGKNRSKHLPRMELAILPKFLSDELLLAP